MLSLKMGRRGGELNATALGFLLRRRQMMSTCNPPVATSGICLMTLRNQQTFPNGKHFNPGVGPLPAPFLRVNTDIRGLIGAGVVKESG
jgi:hypothetical protein